MSIIKYKANKNLLLREIAGEYLLIPVGELAMKVHGMISLTESGKLLWDKLQNSCTEEELVSCILAEYDIDYATAVEDLKGFIRKMDKVGILERG